MNTKEPANPATGASPTGAIDEHSAARAVELMFDKIAPRYDLANHVLSGNVDKLWWRATANRFRAILENPEARVIDLCCGTGDMTLALRRLAPNGAYPYIGVDFSHKMLTLGEKKFHSHGIIPIEADALELPFATGRFDLLTSAFGFRNLSNYQAGLREICRVLKPGGEFGILDFSEPGGLFGKLYALYFRHVLPRIGGLLSGSQEPYKYLPASVHRFPTPSQLIEQMIEVGFTDVTWTPYILGIAGLYRGRKI